MDPKHTPEIFLLCNLKKFDPLLLEATEMTQKHQYFMKIQ